MREGEENGGGQREVPMGNVIRETSTGDVVYALEAWREKGWI